MPCTDGGPSPSEEARFERQRADWFKATLCGIFTHLEAQPIEGLLNDLLDNLDYEEMGVTREEVQAWWHKHKLADKRRRAEEARKKRAEEARKRGLEKLTTEERQALGL